ncbi:MAG: PRC-barrel domain-containing protein [Candidatus Peribacteraceae bacterium]|nr:PRC-barrel domain-containing protein [Candidatus Peribacteraceae bacterium]
MRYSTSRGLPVFDEHAGEVVGIIDGMLVHPDSGRIEGFFVRVPRFLFSAEEFFLPIFDIVHWGLKVSVRTADVLAPPQEFLRVAPLLESGRPVLGQVIRTESGRTLGKCRDVQWNTKTLMLEWIFPRRWFRWQLPVPASAIIEVRREAVIVRDPATAVKEPEGEKKSLLEVLPDIAETIAQPTT